MPSNHLILCRPFSSCPQSFPASGSFPKSWLFASGSQSVGALALVLPTNIQGWFPLGLTNFISLQSRGTLESSPAPQFKSINSSVLRLLYGPILTSVHDYHSFDYIDFCRHYISKIFWDRKTCDHTSQSMCLDFWLKIYVPSMSNLTGFFFFHSQTTP